MPKMTRERARFLIVDAMADFTRGGELRDPMHFWPSGAASDDDATTWADVFATADLRNWSAAASTAADIADAIAARANGEK